jgi:Zn-dependent protease
MGDLLQWPPGWSTLLLLPALFVGFTVHELAHAVLALLLGDTSQVERNRLTFNPLRHVSWVGLIVFLLFRFGWAKPVSVDASRFRMKNQAFGMFLVSISGACANLLTALLVLVGMTATVMVVWTVTGVQPIEIMQVLMPANPGPDAQGVATALGQYMMMVNFLLAVFNLIPLPPLDGFQAAISLYLAVRVQFRGESAAVPVRGRLGLGTLSTGVGSQAPVDGTDHRSRSAPVGEADRRSPAQIHFDIGLDYQKEGQWDEAIARYRQATAVDKRFSLAYYNLGLAYWAKGREDLARSAFRAALRTAVEPSVRLQAELRLHELEAAAHSKSLNTEAQNLEPGSLPPPLEPGSAPEIEPGKPPALAPGVARRVWLRLGLGSLGFLLLAAAAWFYVTGVAFMSVV